MSANPVFSEGAKSSQGLRGRLDESLEEINTDGGCVV